MSINTIEWHRRCLHNMEVSHLALIARILEMQNQRRAQLARIDTLRAQINRAEAEGRSGFDGDRFNVPRKETPAPQPANLVK